MDIPLPEAGADYSQEFAAEELGTSDVVLDQSTCQEQECLLGDFMADAMFAYRRNSSEDVDFALINAGGIRATIDEGEHAWAAPVRPAFKHHLG